MLMKDTAIGIDIEAVSRFEKYAASREKAEKMKLFTKAELDYCYKKHSPAQNLAARYCAKEATVKAMSTLGFKTYYGRVEVIKAESGAPGIRLSEGELEKKVQITVSLTHTKTQAQAIVIARKI